jgi:hypothetical protein
MQFIETKTPLTISHFAQLNSATQETCYFKLASWFLQVFSNGGSIVIEFIIYIE